MGDFNYWLIAKIQSILELCSIHIKMASSTSTETNITTTEPPPKKQKTLEYKGMIENIQKILECPVCYKSPGDPNNVHFCSNGPSYHLHNALIPV